MEPRNNIVLELHKILQSLRYLLNHTVKIPLPICRNTVGFIMNSREVLIDSRSIVVADRSLYEPDDFEKNYVLLTLTHRTPIAYVLKLPKHIEVLRTGLRCLAPLCEGSEKTIEVLEMLIDVLKHPKKYVDRIELVEKETKRWRFKPVVKVRIDNSVGIAVAEKKTIIHLYKINVYPSKTISIEEGKIKEEGEIEKEIEDKLLRLLLKKARRLYRKVFAVYIFSKLLERGV